MKTQIANVTKIASTNRLTRIASLGALFLMLCFASGVWAQAPVLVTNYPNQAIPVTTLGTSAPLQVAASTPIQVFSSVGNPVYVGGQHSPFAYYFIQGQHATFYCPNNVRCVITHVTVGGCNAGSWLVGVLTWNATTGSGFSGTNFLYTETNMSSGGSCGGATYSSKLYSDPNKTVQVNFPAETGYVVPPGMNVSIFGYDEPEGYDDF